MTPTTLAKRYALALLDKAERLNQVEQFESVLLSLKSAFQQNERVRSVLCHPRIPRPGKKLLLRSAFDGKVHPTFVRFLDVLVDKNRVAYIPEVADQFDRLADRSKGVVRVEVRAFRSLGPDHKRRLSERVSKLLGGKQVELQEVVDPNVRGGVAIRIGDSVIDGTIQGRLRRLREELFVKNQGLLTL